MTVLSSDDPVRVYERFATLDAVAARIAAAVAALGIERFDLKYASGSMPHEHLLTYIGALRHRGIPRVRALLAR